MQRYIQQLLDHYQPIAEQRSKEAKATFDAWMNKPSSSQEDASSADFLPDMDMPNEDDMAAHFADVEAYLEGPRKGIDQPLAYYAQIDLTELPAADSISNEEAEALFEVLNSLISTYGHTVEIYLAEDAPANLYYNYLLQVLAKPTRMMSSPGGHSGHGCQYWAPGCEFGKYCCSLEDWYKEEFVEQGGDPTIEEARFGNKEEILRKRAEEEKEMEEWEGQNEESPGDF